MADEIFPRKCTPENPCPDPTEIVCIEVLKVYDFCFASERKENVCFDIPPACYPPVPPDATVTCSITAVSCDEISRRPSATPGLTDVTLKICVDVTLTITPAGGGLPSCTFSDTFCFIKTVTLCAPDGTEVQCEIPNFRCGPCFVMPNNEVCCEIDVCILIQAKAVVKLLVPAYGFCIPAECVQVVKPPIVCPPEQLFPPQCDPAAVVLRK